MDNEIGGRRRRPAGIKKKTPPPREEGWEWAVSSYACRIKKKQPQTLERRGGHGQ